MSTLTRVNFVILLTIVRVWSQRSDLSFRMQTGDNATDCIEAGTEYAVALDVSGCQITAAPYLEYDLISVTIDECNIPAGLAPLTFQLSVADPKLLREEPVTVAQFSQVFLLPGPPSFPESPGHLVFVATICDLHQSCQKFASKEIEVKNNVNATKKVEDLLQIAQRHHTAGFTSLALSVLSTAMKIPDRESAMEAVDATLSYTVSGLESPSMRLQQGDGSVLVSSLTQALTVTRERRLVRKILSAIEKVMRKLTAFKMLPSTIVIDRLIQTICDLSETVIDASIMSQARITLRAVTKSIAAGIPIGSRIEFGKGIHSDSKVSSVYMLAVHDKELQDVSLETPFNDTDSVQVGISFDSELVRDFKGEWECETLASCQSVIVIYKLFPGKGPFPDQSENFRISPTIEITVHSPESGAEKRVSGYLSALSVQISLTQALDLAGSAFETRCQFWDEDSQTWKSDGVHLLWQTTGKASCWTGHLTAFTVSRIRAGSLIGSVIGVSLILLLLFLLMALVTACVSCRTRKGSVATAAAEQLVSRM